MCTYDALERSLERFAIKHESRADCSIFHTVQAWCKECWDTRQAKADHATSRQRFFSSLSL